MVDIYHRAARDGYIDLLKSASKRDANRKDEDGMTPVHYAASCGNVEALRLLVGKGGDPDKPNFDGATAVHLAAHCGQLNCLSFLTNFGCNIWALNNDGRTPLEDSAYHGRMDCVRHLDGLIAIQMLRNKKEVEKHKVRAKREAIKRVKKQSKLQQDRDKTYETRVQIELQNQYDDLGSIDKNDSSNGTWKGSTRSVNSEHHFSELASGKGFDEEDEHLEALNTHAYSETYSQRSRLFKVLKGKIHNTFNRRKKTKDDDFFNKHPSLSQPNLFQGSINENSLKNVQDRRSQSKNRLASGSVTSDSDEEDVDLPIGHIIKKYDGSGNVSTEIHYDQSSSRQANGTVSSRRTRQGSSSSSRSARSHDVVSIRSGFDDNENLTEMAGSNEMKAVITFLSGLNLEQFSSSFLKESIDLNALVLCSDKDLQELGLPLGPRRKILEAVRRRQIAIQNPASMADTKI